MPQTEATTVAVDALRNLFCRVFRTTRFTSQVDPYQPFFHSLAFLRVDGSNILLAQLVLQSSTIIAVVRLIGPSFLFGISRDSATWLSVQTLIPCLPPTTSLIVTGDVTHRTPIHAPTCPPSQHEGSVVYLKAIVHLEAMVSLHHDLFFNSASLGCHPTFFQQLSAVLQHSSAGNFSSWPWKTIAFKGQHVVICHGLRSHS